MSDVEWAITPPMSNDVEVIAIGIHARKLILSPPQTTTHRVLEIGWYDENALASCDVGTSFSLRLMMNLIVASHNEKNILDAEGRDHEWLVKLLEAGEEIGVTITEKEP